MPGLDLVIADEAHRCAGRVSIDFATVLDADAIPARQRLFMTATPRFFTGRVVQEAKEADFEVASMDDESDVSARSSTASVSPKRSSADCSATTRSPLSAWTTPPTWSGPTWPLRHHRRHRGHRCPKLWLDRSVWRRRCADTTCARTISFHSRVSAAREFAELDAQARRVDAAGQRPRGTLWSQYVSGEMSAGERIDAASITSATSTMMRTGCWRTRDASAEGIDVPALDGVAFIDPRRSEVDIVQAVGRAIRLAENKTVGTIVIPVFIEAEDDPDAALDDSAFKPVWDVIRRCVPTTTDLANNSMHYVEKLDRGASSVTIPSKIHLDLPARIGLDFAIGLRVRLVEQTTASWEFWFGMLQRFVEREGHTHIAALYVEDGLRLGAWVHMQRTYYSDGKIAPDRSP